MKRQRGSLNCTFSKFWQKMVRVTYIITEKLFIAFELYAKSVLLQANQIVKLFDKVEKKIV